jgi:hypothetical protein
MSTVTNINGSDTITSSRTVINTNFSNLNTDKIETSTLDTDTSLAANSDSKIATQKAVKAYVDAGGNINASETARGIVEEATDAEVTAGTATGATGAKLFVTPTKLLTYLATQAIAYKQGTTTKALGDATGTVDITHGLGRTPKKIWIASNLHSSGVISDGSGEYIVADGTYTSYSYYKDYDTSFVENFSTTDIVRVYQGSTTAYQTATITAVSSTIFTITWTKSNSPSGSVNVMWRVEG